MIKLQKPVVRRGHKRLECLQNSKGMQLHCTTIERLVYRCHRGPQASHMRANICNRVTGTAFLRLVHGYANASS
jgi:hypothetical protein